jgi:hypothetical protein
VTCRPTARERFGKHVPWKWILGNQPVTRRHVHGYGVR